MGRRAIVVLFSTLLAVGSASVAAQDARMAQTESPEAVLWRTVRETKNPADLAAYLRAFPGGAHAAEARKRLEALRGAAAVGGALPRASPTYREETVTAVIGKRGITGLGLLGVGTIDVHEALAKALGLKTAEGLLVIAVIPGSGAERAGIAPGDIILSFFGKDVRRNSHFDQLTTATAPGTRAAVRLLRPLAGSGDLLDRLRRLASTGDGVAMLGLGYAYESGQGVAKDETEAVRWYRKAAERGDAEAMQGLAWAYRRGGGVGKDAAEAARWSRKAAERGHAGAMTDLGYAYELGKGVAKDLAQAVRWYRKAAERGDPNGMASLGWMYANGRGVAKTLTEAVRWYRKAAERGHAGAMNNLGAAYLRGKGVGQDDAMATLWYRKAAERGHGDAMRTLGWMYANGRGVFKNEAEAVRWYRKAAEAGHPRAMTTLGYAYEVGKGVAKDLAEALRWYRKAAEARDPVGMANLGIMYEYGRGVAKDQARAAHWYKRGDERGALRATHNLGSLYDDGKGVRRDPKEAARLVFKALKGGYDFSVKQMTTNADAWSRPFRRELQRLMREAGVYDGSIDGNFGPATRRAVKALAGR